MMERNTCNLNGTYETLKIKKFRNKEEEKSAKHLKRYHQQNW